MFTGIIEEIGTVKSIQKSSESAKLAISAEKIMDDVRIGDSIAVNGVCLTATTVSAKGFTADVMAETLRRSSLGSLAVGGKVNLERAMLAGGRFGGHIVSGHIDGTGTITSLDKEGNAIWVTISADSSILKLIIEKGSIAIDGISLTVAYVDDKSFKVSIIPHTQNETTLTSKNVGDTVNLENDIIGKYVGRLMSYDVSDNSGKKELSMDTLISNGFI
ncbi:MAG: riboflavin synthase [Eubacterium sp.]|nr:riboflavin synthase [Eubacterium sp.]